MITQVACPGNLPERWRNYIQFHHEQTFGYRTHNIHEHWWYVKTRIIGRELHIAGFAGMKQEMDDSIFIGPCIVHPQYRKLGLQKKFIRHREEEAKKLGYSFAVTFTHFQNYSSANNFVRGGYLITKPWDDKLDGQGVFIYFRKRLKK